MAVGEWDHRQLCPDGACVGVIGPDGTCKVCGRAAQNWGDERKRGLIEPEDEDADDSDDDDRDPAAPDDGEDEDEDGDYEDDDDEYEDDDEEDDGDDDGGDADCDGAIRAAAAGERAGEWGVRRLCPDGGCIGVIDASGRCKVCGRAATGDAGARGSSEPAPAAGASAQGGSEISSRSSRASGPAAEDPDGENV